MRKYLGFGLLAGMGMIAVSASPAASPAATPAPETKSRGDTASTRSTAAPAKAKVSDPAPEGKVRRGTLPSGYVSNPGYRSKGKQAKPRKRPNRRHISRRVRRAHRRAKAA